MKNMVLILALAVAAQSGNLEQVTASAGSEQDFCWKLLVGMGGGIVAVAGFSMWCLHGWLKEKDKRLRDHLDARRIARGGE